RKTKANGGSSPFVAEYIYRNADGTPSRKVCRTADKSFPQFHWDGSRWIAGVKGVPDLPFRLPELLKAGPAVPVYVVEGEKDALALAKLGFTATTSAGGAGKWKPALNEHFKDRKIYVIPDNDTPGRKHAQDVAQHLDK